LPVKKCFKKSITGQNQGAAFYGENDLVVEKAPDGPPKCSGFRKNSVGVTVLEILRGGGTMPLPILYGEKRTRLVKHLFLAIKPSFLENLENLKF